MSGGKEGVAARQVAVTIVLQVEQNQAWASPVADRVLAAANLDDQDRAFAANLAFSTLRWQGTLEWVLGHCVSRPLDDVEATLLAVLRVGTWELLHGNQPTHAVVDSHVEVARSLVGQRATGFVNGVLRGVARRSDALPWPDEASPEGLGLRTGYPAWIAAAARERFGAERGRAVLEAGNEPAPLVLRAVAPREEVLEALAEHGVGARPGGLSPDAVVLTERVPPKRLRVLSDGRAIVQDQASQIVGSVAADGLAPGAVAIDLCAAPGGKATHLAQRGLRVTAVDRHAGRLRRAAELASRLGLELDTVTADGTDPGLPQGTADVVLVDAPCSGLGVVRRRPELRWRRHPDDVAALAQTQRSLLTAAAGLAKPGGRIVYSVCTWTAAEADEVVAAVVADGTLVLGGQPDVGAPTSHGVQLSPDRTETDGMFISVCVRADGSGDA